MGLRVPVPLSAHTGLETLEGMLTRRYCFPRRIPNNLFCPVVSPG